MESRIKDNRDKRRRSLDDTQCLPPPHPPNGTDSHPKEFTLVLRFVSTRHFHSRRSCCGSFSSVACIRGQQPFMHVAKVSGRLRSV